MTGWQTFCDHFAAHGDHFLLIGGTATELAMTEAGLPFRGTQDLDIVLVIEVLNREFLARFWAFIKAGNYDIQQPANEPHPKRFRFVRQSKGDFPYMIELFSRKPDGLDLPDGAVVTPIPDDGSSISAILLDDAYYQFVLDGRRKTVDGIPWVGHDRLIPLKATAWRNLTHDRAEGKPNVKPGDILKHAQDVRNLAGLLTEGVTIALPPHVYEDLEEFLAEAQVDMATGASAEAVATAVSRIRAAFIRTSVPTS